MSRRRERRHQTIRNRVLDLLNPEVPVQVAKPVRVTSTQRSPPGAPLHGSVRRRRPGMQSGKRKTSTAEPASRASWTCSSPVRFSTMMQPFPARTSWAGKPWAACGRGRTGVRALDPRSRRRGPRRGSRGQQSAAPQRRRATDAPDIFLYPRPRHIRVLSREEPVPGVSDPPLPALLRRGNPREMPRR